MQKMPQNAADAIKKAREKLDQIHGLPDEIPKALDKKFGEHIDDATKEEKAIRSRST